MSAKISVIVPVYNAESYLKDCLDSVLAQTMPDFELVAVDDGSTDGSGLILDGYAARDTRVRVLHQPNGGPSSARNAGFDLSSCPYVYFIDSDDILSPSLLQTVLPRLQEGYDTVAFGFELLRKDGVREPADTNAAAERVIRPETDEERFAFLTGPFRRRVIRWELWNKVFRRDIIERWNIRSFDSRQIVTDDMCFSYEYIAHCRQILLLPDVLYTYRLHEGSFSSVFSGTLMIRTSHVMTRAIRDHYASCEDCRYLTERFDALYFLLHKGAVRRLRLHQWRSRLSMEEARRLLADNLVDPDEFFTVMTAAFDDPAVTDSYRQDRGVVRQRIERLYTAGLLQIPASRPARAARAAALALLPPLFRAGSAARKAARMAFKAARKVISGKTGGRR